MPESPDFEARTGDIHGAAVDAETRIGFKFNVSDDADVGAAIHKKLTAVAQRNIGRDVVARHDVNRDSLGRDVDRGIGLGWAWNPPIRGTDH